MEINRCGVWKLIVVDGVESKSIVVECGNQSLWTGSCEKLVSFSVGWGPVSLGGKYNLEQDEREAGGKLRQLNFTNTFLKI